MHLTININGQSCKKKKRLFLWINFAACSKSKIKFLKEWYKILIK